MEKVSFKNSRNLSLAGNFWQNDSDKIIVLCHGFTGDKTEEGRFDILADALFKEGFNVLAFDFSGSGESNDEPLNSESFLDDLNCAIRWAKSKGIKKIGLVGHSFGGNIVCRVDDKDIITRVLWAPTTKASEMMEYQLSRGMKQIDKDTFVRPKGAGLRKEVRISRQILEYFPKIDQKSLLSAIKTPMLIVHGDKDQHVPIEFSVSAMNYLPDSSQLKIIKGADHYFPNMVDRFITPTVKWFKEKM